MIVTNAWGELWSNLSLNDRLVEGCIWSLKKQSRQDVQTERLISICSWFVAEEAQSKLSLLVSWSHQIWHELLFFVDELTASVLKQNL